MSLCSFMSAEYDDLPEAVKNEVQTFADVNVAWLSRVLSAAAVVSAEEREHSRHLRRRRRRSDCNKDCLSGERHAGTFERNNTKDDPRAVGWDQANQSIGQRSMLHLRKGRPKPSFSTIPFVSRVANAAQ
jgi:hypothetical protein